MGTDLLLWRRLRGLRRLGGLGRVGVARLARRRGLHAQQARLVVARGLAAAAADRHLCESADHAVQVYGGAAIPLALLVQRPSL